MWHYWPRGNKLKIVTLDHMSIVAIRLKCEALKLTLYGQKYLVYYPRDKVKRMLEITDKLMPSVEIECIKPAIFEGVIIFFFFALLGRIRGIFIAKVSLLKFWPVEQIRTMSISRFDRNITYVLKLAPSNLQTTQTSAVCVS